MFQDLDKLAAQLNELGVVSGNEPPSRPPRAPTNGQGIISHNSDMFWIKTSTFNVLHKYLHIFRATG